LTNCQLINSFSVQNLGAISSIVNTRFYNRSVLFSWISCIVYLFLFYSTWTKKTKNKDDTRSWVEKNKSL